MESTTEHITMVPNILEVGSPIEKVLMWTDIHWGARNNGAQHNQDNLDFIDWMISVVNDVRPSHLMFLGDWFENRNAINVLTLNMAYEGLKRLNEIGLPIFMIVGNHDIHGRNNRSVHSVLHFNEFSNVTVIDVPTVVDQHLMCPFLFREEYPSAVTMINAHRYVYGHFEFRNFVVTGSTKLMDHGPDHSMFHGPQVIFSGHYHRRQSNDNIVYIGNTFSTNYGDVEDPARGCCVFDVTSNETTFHNWPDAPVFLKTKLSEVLDGRWEPRERARVRCLLDVEISYSDAQVLRDEMVKAYGLREFQLEEDIEERKDAMSEERLDVAGMDGMDLIDTIGHMIKNGVPSTASIDPTKLIEVWEDLR